MRHNTTQASRRTRGGPVFFPLLSLSPPPLLLPLLLSLLLSLSLSLSLSPLLAMATSSSDGSCTAPADFQLSSELEDASSRLSMNLLKCPLCHNSRRIFYCRQCVQNGDFIHSNTVYSERCVWRSRFLLPSFLHFPRTELTDGLFFFHVRLSPLWSALFLRIHYG